MRKTLITLTALTAIIGAGVIGSASTAQAAPAFVPVFTSDQARPLVQQVEYYGDWRREREWRRHEEERRREEARWHRHHDREW